MPQPPVILGRDLVSPPSLAEEHWGGRCQGVELQALGLPRPVFLCHEVFEF